MPFKGVILVVGACATKPKSWGYSRFVAADSISNDSDIFDSPFFVEPKLHSLPRPSPGKLRKPSTDTAMSSERSGSFESSRCSSFSELRPKLHSAHAFYHAQFSHDAARADASSLRSLIPGLDRLARAPLDKKDRSDSLIQWIETRRVLNELIMAQNSREPDGWMPSLCGTHREFEEFDSEHAVRYRVDGVREIELTDFLGSRDTTVYKAVAFFDELPETRQIKYANNCYQQAVGGCVMMPGVKKNFAKNFAKNLFSHLKSFCRIQSSKVYLSEPDSVHPSTDSVNGLRDEYLILKTIDFLVSPKNSKISPLVYALSSAVVSPPEVWSGNKGVPDVRLLSRSVTDLVRTGAVDQCGVHNAMARAMVMEDMRGMTAERIIQNMFHHSAEQTGNAIIIRGLELGLELVRLLQKLHDIGFVHGGITPVSLFRIEGEKPKWILVNFDFAKFFPSEIGTAEYVSGFRLTSPDVRHKHLSMWGFEGIRFARRDDISAALETTAQLLLPNGALDRLIHATYNKDDGLNRKRHKGNFEHMRKFRTNSRLFTGNIYDYNKKTKTSTTLCQYYDLSFRTECHIATGILEEALFEVRRIGHPDDRPNYAEIISSFEEALETLTSDSGLQGSDTAGLNASQL